MVDTELLDDLFEDEVQGEVLVFACTKALSYEDE